MRHQSISSLVTLALVITLSGATGLGQSVPVDPDWVLPRTPDGHPDMQGLWSYATITPLERPAEFADLPFLSEAEIVEYEDRRLQEMNMDRRDGTAAQDVSRAYNDFWWDRGTTIVATGRTSLVIDPPDGRIPPRNPDSPARGRGGRSFDGPEDRPLGERCLMFGSGGAPMTPTAYNNNVQIFQTGDHVAMVHDTRIVPLNARPPLPDDVRLWLGDPRGHWEGDTLVVETKNFSDQKNFRGAGENLTLTERFTRVSEDTLLYQFTVDDPVAFTRPWTVEIPLWKNPGLMYEYACHEGNTSLAGVLSGARARELAAAEGEEQ
jgi:hypothetical protein